MPELSNEYLIGLVELFRNVVNFLNEKEICYFIDGGTMLGALRDKVLEHADELEERHNLFVIVHSGMLKIENQNIYRISKDDKGKIPVTIDLLLYHRPQGLNRVELALPEHRKLWGKCYHLDKDFEPFQKMEFEDFTVNCVKNPVAYLQRYYGDDWMTPKDIEYETHTY